MFHARHIPVFLFAFQSAYGREVRGSSHASQQAESSPEKSEVDPTQTQDYSEGEGNGDMGYNLVDKFEDDGGEAGLNPETYGDSDVQNQVDSDVGELSRKRRSTPKGTQSKTLSAPKKKWVLEIFDGEDEKENKKGKGKGPGPIKGAKGEKFDDPETAMVEMAESLKNMAKVLNEKQCAVPPPVPEEKKSDIMLWSTVLGRKVEKLPARAASRVMRQIDNLVYGETEEHLEAELNASKKA